MQNEEFSKEGVKSVSIKCIITAFLLHVTTMNQSICIMYIGSNQKYAC